MTHDPTAVLHGRRAAAVLCRRGHPRPAASPATVRPRHARVMMRFEGLPGEFSQHDFGQVRLRYLDGTHSVVRFFGSRPKWSRWAAVDLHSCFPIPVSLKDPETGKRETPAPSSAAVQFTAQTPHRLL